jgi:hypothetical protein
MDLNGNFSTLPNTSKDMNWMENNAKQAANGAWLQTIGFAPRELPEI